jgi:hypothetical protein
MYWVELELQRLIYQIPGGKSLFLKDGGLEKVPSKFAHLPAPPHFSLCRKYFTDLHQLLESVHLSKSNTGFQRR